MIFDTLKWMTVQPFARVSTAPDILPTIGEWGHQTKRGHLCGLMERHSDHGGMTDRARVLKWAIRLERLQENR